MIRRAPALVACLAALALAAGCTGSDSPSEDDILQQVELSYPGATETARTWRPEDHDVSVDGVDLSSTAELSRRLRLLEPVPRARLFSWYGERMKAAGWTPRDVGSTAAMFVRTVDDRQHVYWVEAGNPVVDRFTIDYRIGFADE
jgi:hypothetical protein